MADEESAAAEEDPVAEAQPLLERTGSWYKLGAKGAEYDDDDNDVVNSPHESKEVVSIAPPTRVRSDMPVLWIYIAFSIETIFVGVSSLLLISLEPYQTSWYYVVTDLIKIPIWLGVGYEISAQSRFHSRFWKNKYLWARDPLALCGLLVVGVFTFMEVLQYHASKHTLRDSGAIVAIFMKYIAVMCENFMFRVLALGFHFTSFEFHTFKLMQMISCLLVLCLGVIAAKNKDLHHDRQEKVLLIFTMLVWRREMFNCLCRLDGSANFLGIGNGYRLYGGVDWYEWGGDNETWSFAEKLEEARHRTPINTLTQLPKDADDTILPVQLPETVRSSCDVCTVCGERTADTAAKEEAAVEHPGTDSIL